MEVFSIHRKGCLAFFPGECIIHPLVGAFWELDNLGRTRSFAWLIGQVNALGRVLCEEFNVDLLNVRRLGVREQASAGSRWSYTALAIVNASSESKFAVQEIRANSVDLRHALVIGEARRLKREVILGKVDVLRVVHLGDRSIRPCRSPPVLDREFLCERGVGQLGQPELLEIEHLVVMIEAVADFEAIAGLVGRDKCQEHEDQNWSHRVFVVGVVKDGDACSSRAAE